MNLSNFALSGTRRKTLVVLGAGATRGASFVNRASPVLPPLDHDFFQQLSRMPPTKDTQRLLEFIRSEYSHEVGLSMEEFFSEADYTDRFHRDLNVDPGPHVKRYRKALNRFLRVLPDLLNETTARPCRYHEKLASLLHARDCVISFNYDCVMDRALARRAFKRWDPESGSYGFDVGGKLDVWRDHSKGRKVKQPIWLLKMHGSLNWNRVDENELKLVANTREMESLSESIIPPTWFKDLNTFPYSDIWKQARKRIRSSRIIIVIGYSVPETDLFSRSLFKVEAGSKRKREKLDLLVLVNPDSDARVRFLDLVKGGLEDSTIVREYESLEELYWIFEQNAPDDSRRPSPWERLNPVSIQAIKGMAQRLMEQNLTERERKSLILHFGLDDGAPMTAEEIGMLLGMSPEEVHDEIEVALSKVPMSESQLQEAESTSEE